MHRAERRRRERRKCRFQCQAYLSPLATTWRWEGWSGGTYGPPANFLLPWAFWLIFFSRGCREYAPIIRKIIENLKFAVQIEIFQKQHIFCFTSTYSRLCSADHTCMKILFLAGFLNLGVIYSEKNVGSVGHLQKLCKLFPQALIFLKGAMLIYRLMPP